VSDRQYFGHSHKCNLNDQPQWLFLDVLPRAIPQVRHMLFPEAKPGKDVDVAFGQNTQSVLFSKRESLVTVEAPEYNLQKSGEISE